MSAISIFRAFHPESWGGKRGFAVGASLIVGLTLFAFSPSLLNGFTNWDDDRLVFANADIHGTSFRQTIRVFSSFYLNHYAPLTMLSFMAEYSLFGAHPLPYHATNLLLHILNAVLVFAFIKTLSGNLRIGLLTALLFALHPLRVESVAWIAERKGLLSACFYFSSLLMYARYCRVGRGGWYGGSLLAFAASLLSKSMAVSLPFVLLLVDYAAGRRIGRRELMEKTPFFLLAAAGGIIALIGARGTGYHHSCTLVERLVSPLLTVLFYIFKTVVPVRLCALYDGGGMPAAAAVTATIILLAVIVLIVRCRIDNKKKIFGAAFFLVTLAPAMQIVSSGGWTNLADRYTYIPHIGLFYFFAESAAAIYRRRGKFTRRTLTAGIATTLLCCAVITSLRCLVWRDSFTLWNDTIGKCPGAVAYCNRGIAWKSAGNLDSALADLDRAIAFDSLYAFSYGNRGEVFIRFGDFERALADFTRAISLDPNYASAYRNRGGVYLYRGEYDRALSDFHQDIRINPRHAEAYYNRGLAYSVNNDFERAIADYTQAIVLDSTCSRAYYNRSIVFGKIGDRDREQSDLEKACASGLQRACEGLMKNHTEAAEYH
ncbi:MAG: tetratricopeptide repeat protein [Chitinispirillaceae bacterium]|nr:tetratricopeptide repeat protein [Chitinispirillaceae bacterium]